MVPIDSDLCFYESKRTAYLAVSKIDTKKLNFFS